MLIRFLPDSGTRVYHNVISVSGAISYGARISLGPANTESKRFDSRGKSNIFFSYVHEQCSLGDGMGSNSDSCCTYILAFNSLAPINLSVDLVIAIKF